MNNYNVINVAQLLRMLVFHASLATGLSASASLDVTELLTN